MYSTRPCPNCRQAVPDGQPYCPYCGMQMPAVAPQAQAAPQSRLRISNQKKEQPAYQPQPMPQQQPVYQAPVQPTAPQPAYQAPVQPAAPQPVYTPPVQPVYEQPAVPTAEQPFEPDAPVATETAPSASDIYITAAIEKIDKKSRRNLIIGIIVAVLAIAAIAGGIIYYNMSSSEPAEKELFFKNIDWSLSYEDFKESDVAKEYEFKFESEESATFIAAEGIPGITDKEVTITCSFDSEGTVTDYSFHLEYSEETLNNLLKEFGEEFEDNSTSSTLLYSKDYDENTEILIGGMEPSGSGTEGFLLVLFKNRNYVAPEPPRVEGAFYISDIVWGSDREYAKTEFSSEYSDEDTDTIEFEFSGLESVYSRKTTVYYNYDYDGNPGLTGVSAWLEYDGDGEELYQEVVDYFDASYSSQIEGYISRDGEYLICIQKDESYVSVIVMENE